MPDLYSFPSARFWWGGCSCISCYKGKTKSTPKTFSLGLGLEFDKKNSQPSPQAPISNIVALPLCHIFLGPKLFKLSMQVCKGWFQKKEKNKGIFH